jgi:hypothetical protein
MVKKKIYIYIKQRETKVRLSQYLRDMGVCEQFCGEYEYLKTPPPSEIFHTNLVLHNYPCCNILYKKLHVILIFPLISNFLLCLDFSSLLFL